MKGDISVHLGQKLPDWKDYCEAKGLKPAGYLAVLARRELAGAIKDNVKKQARIEEREDGVKMRCVITFTASELEWIKKFAEEEGVTAQQLVISTMRRVLTGVPAFNEEETKALWSSNQGLSRIGTNINQVARRVNDQKNHIEPSLLDRVLTEITRASQVIDAHTEQVARLISSNIHRWRIVHEQELRD